MVQFPRWQLVLVLAVLVIGLVFAAPNLLERDTADSLPGWVPNQQVSLGLDLQGGSHLLLEVDLDYVVREQLDNLVDGIRVELRRTRLGYTNLGIESGAATFTLRDASTIDRARGIVRDLAGDLLIEVSEAGRFRIAFTPQARDERRRNVVEQSIEIVRRRIDETGTREPSIQRQGDERILVQLPGVRDPERIKNLLGKTAKLTFRFVDETAAPGVGRVPAGSEELPSDERDGAGNARSYIVKKRVMVSGENLTDAAATFQDNQPVVRFAFDTVGSKRFCDASTQNVGKLANSRCRRPRTWRCCCAPARCRHRSPSWRSARSVRAWAPIPLPPARSPACSAWCW
jgi:protein-export membrane protein SecD